MMYAVIDWFDLRGRHQNNVHDLRNAKDVAKKYGDVAEKMHVDSASIFEESRRMTQKGLRFLFCSMS